MSISRVLTLALAALLTGCTTVGEVSQLDRNTYSVTVETTANASSGDLQAKAIAKAKSFCDAKQQDMVFLESQLSHRDFSTRDYIFHFRCVKQ